MPEMLRLAVPGLVSVTVWGIGIVLRSCVPKVRLAGDSVTVALPAYAAWLHPSLRSRANRLKMLVIFGAKL